MLVAASPALACLWQASSCPIIYFKFFCITLVSSDLANFVNSKSMYGDYSTTVLSSVNYELSIFINSSFLCFGLFALFRTANTVLNRNRDCKHNRLIPILREVLVIFPYRSFVHSVSTPVAQIHTS